jgi:hypothetical protein
MPETTKQVAAKPTPEPWVVRDNGDGRLFIEAHEADGTKCQPAAVLGDCDDPEYGPMIWANARLIAAAPKMLAACRAARPYIADMIKRGALPQGEDDSHFGDVQALKAIDTAIAKAEAK